MRPTGFVLTFLSVAGAMVLFRSANAGSAKELLQGMVGLNGISLPHQVLAQLGPLTALLRSSVSASTDMSAQQFVLAMAWLGVLLLIALLLPNTLQLVARYEPALGVRSRPVGRLSLLGALEWAPSVPWAVAMSALVIAATMRLGGKSEFLYWQF
jgi:hypothetical protein